MSIERSASPRDARGIVCALVTALFCGAFDVALGCLRQVPSLQHLELIAPSLLAGAALVVALYGLIWATLARPLAARAQLARGALQAALGFALATFFVLLRVAEFSPGNAGAAQLFDLGLFAALALVVGASAYFAAAHIEADARWRAVVVPWLLVVPALALEVLAFIWVQIYYVDSVASPKGVALVSALAVLVSVTLLSARRAPLRARRLSMSMVGAWCLASLASTIWPSVQHMLGGSGRTDHATRHVILVTADALRADALGVYGNTRVKTPAIDSFAADAVVFEHDTAVAPWTIPSLSTLLTGVSPAVHLVQLENGRLPASFATLAERFQAAGYRTAAFVDNPFLRPEIQFNQGFDEYHFLDAAAYGNVIGARLASRALPMLFRAERPWTIEEHTGLVQSWIARNAGRDFFLWVHLFDPHAPYAPERTYVQGEPPPGLGYSYTSPTGPLGALTARTAAEQDWIRGLYEAEVRGVDAHVGRIFDQLRELELYDDALIVFTSDHGEEFWEHGANGHGHTLFNELLSVPLLIKLPHGRHKGRIATRVSSERVVATVMEAADVQFDSTAIAPSLLALMHGEASGKQAPVISMTVVGPDGGQMVDNLEAVFVGEHKYIRSMVTASEKIYDLATDPAEQRPLSDAAFGAEALGLLKQGNQAAHLLRERNGVSEDEVAALDAGTLRRLRGLGYIQ